MALDPQIALGVQIPTPQNPTTALANMESVAALRDQREALAEQRQQQAQALIQKAKDNAAKNVALQQSGGDLLKAGDFLTQNGNGLLGQEFYQQHAEQTQKMAAALKAQHDVAQAHLDMALQIASTMGDSPEHYAAGRQAIKGLIGDDPQLGPWFQQYVPENPDPSQIPTIVSGLTKVGNDAKTNAANQQKDVEDFMAGKTSQATASRLLSLPPQMRPQALALAAQMSRSTEARTALLQQFGPIINDDAALKKAGTTVEQQVTADEAAKRDAETARHNAVSETTAQYRATHPASAVAAPVDQDAVKEYADKLKAGLIADTAIPAAGGMRNAVQAYMRQQGFDTKQPLTAQVRARYEFASSQLPLIDKVEALAKQIDQIGLTGTMSGRLRQLGANESFASTLEGLTPEQRALVGKFETEADFLGTGVAMTHFGARAGGEVVKDFRDKFGLRGKDLQTYLGDLAAARDVLTGYKNDLPSLNRSGSANDPLGIRKGGG